MKHNKGLKHILSVLATCLLIILTLIGGLIYYQGAPKITAVDQSVEYDSNLVFAKLADVDHLMIIPVKLSIESDNADGILIDETSVTFEKPGKYELIAKATDIFHRESEAIVRVEVIDNVPPEVELVDSPEVMSYAKAIHFSLDGGGDGVHLKVSDRSDVKMDIKNIHRHDGAKLYHDYEWDAEAGNLNLHAVGVFDVDIVIADSYENETSASVRLFLEDDVPPELTSSQSEIQLEVGASGAENIVVFLQARDEIDGNLDDEIVIDDSSVDYSTIGNYQVIATCSDSSKNEAVLALQVSIKDTTAPTLFFTKNLYQLTVGDEAPNYADFAIISDNYDSSVTDRLVVDASAVDYSKEGSYEVVFLVTDSSGNTTSRTAKVEVSKPKVEEVTFIAGAIAGSSGSRTQGSSGSGTIISTGSRKPSSSSGSGSQKDNGDDGGNDVMITKTGSCYHTHKCGRGTYYWVSFSYAKSKGLRPCQRCY